jgi:outer membrane murein-binding lipoprotein Lpp
MELCQGSRFPRMAQVNLVALLLMAGAAAQEAKPAAPADDGGSVSASLNELQSEVQELKGMVQQLKQETTASRAEITRLRQELESDRIGAYAKSAAPAGAEQSSSPGGDTAQVDVRVGHLEEEQQLLSGKVDEQYQTKVESASKYRVRLSGVVLFNLFSNQGSVDNIDVPTLAVQPSGLASSGSFGGTLRQSIFGFEVFGPQLMGARTSGNVNFDVGGGFPYLTNGVNSGLVRLRTATIRLDWKNTDVVVGQDQLFFAPNSPTSFASLIVPALSYSGNLWAWTPQMRVEHRIPVSDQSTFTVQGGILDNLTGEPPAHDDYTWYRKPQAGERARQPAYAARVAYSHPVFGHTFTIGTAGYYSRQNYGYGREVNGYAAMADWNLPLDRWFTLSGSFYRGQAIGGLGGGIWRSVIYNGPIIDPNTAVLPLNTVGGWAQLKYHPTAKLEFNLAFGQDNPFASDVRAFADSQSYGDPTLTRNQGVFGNVIYRPRSDLLFSLEYRHLKTFSIYDDNATAGQVNLGMGILF